MKHGSPIRVALVVHVMQVAGAEMLVAETIERLGSRIDPTVICLDSIGRLGEALLARGVTVLCMDRRPGLDLSVVGRMARALREREVEVVHAHQYTPFFYAALAKLCLVGRRPPRLILTEHGRHFPDEVSPRRRFVNRMLLDRLADHVNAVCRFSARALSRNDGFRGHRIGVIENGIGLSRYVSPHDLKASRVALGLSPHRRYVSCVARFHPIKDHATLLRGFALLATRLPDVDLLLAGEGPLRARLEALARDLGLGERVMFLGVRGDVPAVLRASDAFALTSLCEASSLTVMEAMAAGLPVVVTRVGGNPELVRDEVDGLLVTRGSPEAVRDGLARVLEDPALSRTLSTSARSRAMASFRIERTIDRYLALYRRERLRVIEPIADV
jgi:glycosyltransferase involved in cell wall biosynthesis